MNTALPLKLEDGGHVAVVIDGSSRSDQKPRRIAPILHGIQMLSEHS